MTLNANKRQRMANAASFHSHLRANRCISVSEEDPQNMTGVLQQITSTATENGVFVPVTNFTYTLHFL